VGGAEANQLKGKAQGTSGPLSHIAMNPISFIGKEAIKFSFHLGRMVKLLWEILKAVPDFRTYSKPLAKQMLVIGNRSLTIIFFISILAGMTVSVQTAYNLKSYAPLYFLGSTMEKTILLEFGPLLAAFILVGRVGATIAAELGTMRVTEQIDALESLAFNPVSYLILPRVVAGMIMVPVLTIFADAVGITAGWLTCIAKTNVTTHQFFYGFKSVYQTFDLSFGLIKAVFFGLTITFVSCYEGYYARQGAEGVGRAATNSVVIASIIILILDYFWASALLGF